MTVELCEHADDIPTYIGFEVQLHLHGKSTLTVRDWAHYIEKQILAGMQLWFDDDVQVIVSEHA